MGAVKIEKMRRRYCTFRHFAKVWINPFRLLPGRARQNWSVATRLAETGKVIYPIYPKFGNWLEILKPQRTQRNTKVLGGKQVIIPSFIFTRMVKGKNERPLRIFAFFVVPEGTCRF